MKWRRIDRPKELLSRIFLILKKIEKIVLVVKTGVCVIEPVKTKQYSKFQLDM